MLDDNLSVQKSNAPVVTVIIPTYNRATWIAETLESVFNQTYKNHEIIVVDDGSTDVTQDVLKPYLSRVQYIYKNNGGPASARNAGIKASRGKYVTFLDSDDLWMPEKLQVQVDFMEANPGCAMVFSDYELFGTRILKHFKKPIVRADCTLVDLLKGNKIATLTALVRKSIFAHLGYFDEDPGVISVEDYGMWLRIASHYRIAYLDRPLSKYRVHDSNLSADIPTALGKERAILEKWLESAAPNDPSVRSVAYKRIAFLKFEQGYLSGSKSLLKEVRRDLSLIILRNPSYIKSYLQFACSFLPPRWTNRIRDFYIPIKRFVAM